MSTQINFSIFRGIEFSGNFFDLDQNSLPVPRDSYYGTILSKCQVNSDYPITLTPININTGLVAISIAATDSTNLRRGIYNYSVTGITTSSGLSSQILFGTIRVRDFS